MTNKHTLAAIFSADAETAVLGSLLLNNDLWDEMTPALTKADFYVSAHQIIFSRIGIMLTQGKVADIVTLSAELEVSGYDQETGGFAYLAEIANSIPSMANFAHYVRIVREKSLGRMLLVTGRKICANAASHPDIYQAIEEAETQIFSLNNREYTEGHVIGLERGVTEILDDVEKNSQSHNGITGTPTGFHELDKTTCGLQKSDLILLGARPGVGKTGFAVSLTENILAMDITQPVFIFSLEMSVKQLLMRLLSSVARVDLQNIRSGDLNDEQWAKLGQTFSYLTERNGRLFIDDRSDLTPALLNSRLRKMIRQHGTPCLVILDYIQLMNAPGKENRTQEISEISRSLKRIAKDFKFPLLALSQLNRTLHNRADKRPHIADLRDGGSLEQDADIVMFIHREEMYNSEAEKGDTELIIGKHRQGPVCSIKLAFDARYTRFNEWYLGYGKLS